MLSLVGDRVDQRHVKEEIFFTNFAQCEFSVSSSVTCMLTTCTCLSRRILLAVAISTGLVLNALPLSVSVANASQTPISSDAPWGFPNFDLTKERYLEAPGTLTFPSGLTVSINESGTGIITRQERTCPGVASLHNWANAPWTSSPWTPQLSTGTDASRPFAMQPVFYTELRSGRDIWADKWNCRSTDPNYDWEYFQQPHCPVTGTRLQLMRCARGVISFSFSSPVTDPILHVNNFGASAYAGNRAVMGTQILTLDAANSAFSGTVDLDLVSKQGELVIVEDGPDFLLPNSESRLVGSPAITRSTHGYMGASFAAGSIRFKGTWTTISMKLDFLWFYDAQHTRYDPSWTNRDAEYPKNSCLYDQLPGGPVYECHLVNGNWIPNTTLTNTYAAVLKGIEDTSAPEGVSYLWSVDEDFGTAPASYDASDGASHVLSDLRIGSTVSSSGAELADAQGKVNNSGASGIVSPLAGGVDAGDDAFVSAPAIPLSGNYSVTVPINGVSQAAKLCGWVDADASGTFDVNERQCVNVSAGDTSAALTWPESLTGSVTASTWMRLRLSYDLNGVENPTGRVASGEVEDYQVRRASASSPSTSPSSTEVVSSGKDKVSELPKTGGTLGMTPMGLAFVLTGALVLKSRTRRSRT
jgi:hypothetical protein